MKFQHAPLPFLLVLSLVIITAVCTLNFSADAHKNILRYSVDVPINDTAPDIENLPTQIAHSEENFLEKRTFQLN